MSYEYLVVEFLVDEQHPSERLGVLVDEVLICTWYEDLHSWDHSREVDSADASKWRRRAELEYNHWGIGARRMR